MGLSSFKFSWWAPKMHVFWNGVWNDRSRLSKVTIFGTNRKRIRNFLLVMNSNLGPILPCFRDSPTYISMVHQRQRRTYDSIAIPRSALCAMCIAQKKVVNLIYKLGHVTFTMLIWPTAGEYSFKYTLLKRKASCRWQTRTTLAKHLHGSCKSSGVVSCIASLPIDSLRMVSY